MNKASFNDPATIAPLERALQREHYRRMGGTETGNRRRAADCATKTYALDGKTSEILRKAGTAGAVPVIASHSAENVGSADCQQIFVERK
jgi:hypothetical protein